MKTIGSNVPPVKKFKKNLNNRSSPLVGRYYIWSFPIIYCTVEYASIWTKPAENLPDTYLLGMYGTYKWRSIYYFQQIKKGTAPREQKLKLLEKVEILPFNTDTVP